MKKKLSVLTHAGTAEILRAAQRDELVVENLQQQASDILLQTAGWLFIYILF